MCVFFLRRYLEKLKRYVLNQARPEGSIAEAYILKECINNWSLYIDGLKLFIIEEKEMKILVNLTKD